jgi:hypothetical protein
MRSISIREISLKKSFGDEVTLRRLLKKLASEVYFLGNSNRRHSKAVWKVKHLLAMMSLGHTALTIFGIILHTHACERIGVVLTQYL